MPFTIYGFPQRATSAAGQQHQHQRSACRPHLDQGSLRSPALDNPTACRALSPRPRLALPAPLALLDNRSSERTWFSHPINTREPAARAGRERRRVARAVRAAAGRESNCPRGGMRAFGGVAQWARHEVLLVQEPLGCGGRAHDHSTRPRGRPPLRKRRGTRGRLRDGPPHHPLKRARRPGLPDRRAHRDRSRERWYGDRVARTGARRAAPPYPPRARRVEA